MAERRMFAKTIIDSDAFLDMPVTARLLYYDLSMRADDDGFVNSPKKIMRMIGASQDDLRILALRKFIIPFDSGIVVIKHWRIHNYIRKDTYNKTPYQDELAMLDVDENKAYTMKKSEPSTIRQLTVDEPSTQVRLGKDSYIYSANLRQKSDEIDRKFTLFWSEYPRKIDKKKSFEKFRKINPDDALFQKIMDSLRRWKKTDQWADPQYVPHPTTWLNGERWEDEIPKSKEAVQEDRDLRGYDWA